VDFGFRREGKKRVICKYQQNQAITIRKETDIEEKERENIEKDRGRKGQKEMNFPRQS